MNGRVEEFWAEFLNAEPAVPPDTRYQVWYFGNTPEMALELAELVLQGKKTATASLLETNKRQPANAPIEDGFSIVTDMEGTPMCVIRTAEISHMPFSDVGAAFAFDEGEEDRTLESWRAAHRDYFTKEAASLGFAFDENSIVCCERFKLLFPK
jgi:uncharacterized protein YhfF